MSIGSSHRIWSTGPSAPYNCTTGPSSPRARPERRRSTRPGTRPPFRPRAESQRPEWAGRIPCRKANGRVARRAYAHAQHSRRGRRVVTSNQHHRTVRIRRGSKRSRQWSGTRVISRCARARPCPTCTATLCLEPRAAAPAFCCAKRAPRTRRASRPSPEMHGRRNTNRGTAACSVTSVGAGEPKDGTTPLPLYHASRTPRRSRSQSTITSLD